MAETCRWIGNSGAGYTYFIYEIGHPMADTPGNYIYAKVVSGKWHPVYIGQGNLRNRSDTDTHHKGRCIKRNSATHFHAHRNADERDRKAEEQDLLAHYSTPCNG